jgi:hypothetical protein
VGGKHRFHCEAPGSISPGQTGRHVESVQESNHFSVTVRKYQVNEAIMSSKWRAELIFSVLANVYRVHLRVTWRLKNLTTIRQALVDAKKKYQQVIDTPQSPFYFHAPKLDFGFCESQIAKLLVLVLDLEPRPSKFTMVRTLSIILL